MVSALPLGCWGAAPEARAPAGGKGWRKGKLRLHRSRDKENRPPTDPPCGIVGTLGAYDGGAKSPLRELHSPSRAIHQGRHRTPTRPCPPMVPSPLTPPCTPVVPSPLTPPRPRTPMLRRMAVRGRTLYRKLARPHAHKPEAWRLWAARRPHALARLYLLTGVYEKGQVRIEALRVG